MINKIFSIVILIVVALNLKAQQTTKISQFNLNPFITNPAYAGFGDDTKGFLHYRNDIMGLKGAPITTSLTVDGSITKYNIGMGLSLFNDQVNIIQRTGGNMSYSYGFELPKEQHIYFGISLGWVKNFINYDNIVAENPNELTGIYNYRSTGSFNSDFGALYTLKDLQVGLGATNLFNRKNFKADNLFAYNQNPSYYLSSIYQFEINQDFTGKPSVLIRSSQGLPIHATINAVLDWKNIVWGGISYDTQSSIGFSAGANYQNLTIGYTYGYPTGKLGVASSGMSEIVLGIRFNKGSGINNNKNANYNSSGNSSQSRIPVNKSRRDTVINIHIFEGESPLSNNIAELKRLQNVLLEEQLEINNLSRQNKATINEDAIKTGKGNVVDLQEKDVEIIKEKGIYVVIASYFKFEDAKSLQRILQTEKGLETKIMKSKSGTYYFVFTKKYNEYDNNQVKEELKRIEKANIPEFINGNIWTYIER